MRKSADRTTDVAAHLIGPFCVSVPNAGRRFVRPGTGCFLTSPTARRGFVGGGRITGLRCTATDQEWAVGTGRKARPWPSRSHTAFSRLRAALAVAMDLRAGGLSFVVSPVPGGDGEPLVRAGDEFGVAVYPFVVGQSFGWGEFALPGHLDAVLDLSSRSTPHHGPPACAP